MKITVIGSGAIGGVVGACLTRGGCDVMMLDVVPEDMLCLWRKNIWFRMVWIILRQVWNIQKIYSI